MAKSLRSKWRRKCRAVKRERYGVKELARLKKTLGIDENGQQEVEMSDLSEIATVTDAKTIRETTKKQDEKATQEESSEMDQDGKRVFNKKTMRDQFGNYPVWMNKRRIAKHKKGRGKSLKSTTTSNKRITRKEQKKRKEARRNASVITEDK